MFESQGKMTATFGSVESGPKLNSSNADFKNSITSYLFVLFTRSDQFADR